MSTPIAAPANGRPRKQLADELDRLSDLLNRQDRVIDALAEGLNGAVADANQTLRARVEPTRPQPMITKCTDGTLPRRAGFWCATGYRQA